LDSPAIFGIQHMTDLKKLEEFHFSLDNPDPVNHEVTNLIYTLCAQNLPNLKRIKVCSDLDDVCPVIKATSNLEVLQTQICLPDASLPNLRELTLRGDFAAESKLSSKICSYTRLTTLKLDNVENAGSILKLIGKQLSELHLFRQETVDLFQVFHLCPNLIRFFTSASSTVGNGRWKEKVSSENFRRLEVISYLPDEMKHAFPASLLKMILLAPFITKVTLAQVSLGKKDCGWLRGVDEGRFQKLESFELRCLSLGPGCTMEDLGLMVKWLVCGAARLRKLTLEWCCSLDDSAHDKWEEEQKAAVEFIELLNPKCK